ncbi:MAG TPA: glycosyltransferase family 4 protein [Pirellulales bacterium]|nr:glycosyltransferase family 4 protein [Pirellulales bacterium]
MSGDMESGCSFSTSTVLHLRTVTGRGGGPEKTLLRSPQYLTGEYELRLAYIHPTGDPLYDMPDRAARAGATLVDVPERWALDPQTWRRLAEEIRQSRPAILHAHDYKTNVLAILLGRRFGIPVMTTMHGYGCGRNRLKFYFRLDRWALRRMQRIVAVSADLLEYAIGLGIEPSRCVLVENAIDCGEFSRRRCVAEAKERLGLPADRLLIGAVGRLCEEKAFDRLILAVDQLLSQGLDAQLCIVGEGETRSALEQLIVRLGRQENVRLVGYLSNAADWYEAMDAFALSSVHEGTPNVVLEAMAMEVPLVATRVAGVPKMVEHGVDGLLVEPGDVAGLAQALASLVSDARLRGGLARAARSTVETRYSFAVRMDKIRKIYDDILGRTPSSNLRDEAGGSHQIASQCGVSVS